MPFDNTPLSPRVAPSIGFTLLHSGASSCDFVGGPGGKDGIVSFAHLGPDCKTAMVCLKEPGKPVRRPPRIPADPAKTFQVTGGGGIRKESGAVKEKVEVCWTRGTDERAEQKEMEEGKNGKEGRRKAGEEAKDEEKETKTKKSLSWEWMEPNRTKNRSLGAQENGNKSIGGHPEKAENKTGKGAEDEAKTNPKDSQKETHKTKITGKGDQTSTQNEADSPANSPARKKHRVKPQPSKEYSGDNLEDASPRSSKGKSSQSPEHRLQQTADTKHKEKIARTTTPHFPVPEPKLLSGAPVLTQTLAEYAVDLDAECAALMPSVTTRASSAMTNSFSPAGSVTREHEGLSLTSLMQKDADRAYQQNSSSTLPPPRIFTCPPTASVRLMQKRLSGLIPIRRGSDVQPFIPHMTSGTTRALGREQSPGGEISPISGTTDPLSENSPTRLVSAMTPLQTVRERRNKAKRSSGDSKKKASFRTASMDLGAVKETFFFCNQEARKENGKGSADFPGSAGGAPGAVRDTRFPSNISAQAD